MLIAKNWKSQKVQSLKTWTTKVYQIIELLRLSEVIFFSVLYYDFVKKTCSNQDFTLKLEIDGRPISEDEYLENALKLEQGNTEQIQRCNMPRLYIRKFFPSRKCFTFDRPANKRKLQWLEELEEEDLEPDFLEPMTCFCKHIWSTSQPKTVPGGRVCSQHLAKNYVEAINSGQVPCVENAVQALAEIENTAAMREAIARYEELMEKRMKLSIEGMEELLRVHATSEREATGVFMTRAFGDRIEKFQTELVQTLLQKKKEFCERNEQESFNRCRAVLMDLSQELEDGITRGIYSVSGGYQRFLGKQHEIEERYHLVSGRGIQAEKALQEFLKSKKVVAESILQLETALSCKEKEMEAERVRVQEARFQQLLLEQEKAKWTQMVEDQRRTHEEQFRQLQEKIEREKREWQKETEWMVQQKLKEQEQLLEEGFHQSATQLKSEIKYLKKNNAWHTESQASQSHLRSWGNWDNYYPPPPLCVPPYLDICVDVRTLPTNLAKNQTSQSREPNNFDMKRAYSG
ncbi:UNVERIFIED_CONTAM: hypothetical protein K2H54_029718 [Gekko kuhli]